MAVRHPEDGRQKFLKRYEATSFEVYGVVQNEYVTVADALLENTKELRKYFEISCRYVEAVKPKPSKKKG